MALLAGAVVFLAVMLARHEVARVDRAVAAERLEHVVDRVENLTSRAAEQRYRVKQAASAQPAVIAALQGADMEDGDLREALALLRSPSDSGLPIQIWTPNGGIAYSDMPVALPGERGPQPLAPLEEEPSYGAFHEVEGEVRYYSTAPVRVNGAIIGWVVQLRRLGNPANAATFQDLIGPDARVLLHYPGDSVWITLGGELTPAPAAVPPPDSTVEYVINGERLLLRAKQVQAAPWLVMVETPNVMIGASDRYLRRTLAGGLLLALVAGAVALLLSRRLTRGLRRLSDATRGIAGGDFSTRVDPGVGGEEMTRLAEAFNSMAGEVAASHAALEERLREAQALSRDLSEANRRAEEARARAEEADRAKSEFLATMSHEIRTPINAVLGFSQVLELDDLPDARRREYLQRSQRAARRLASLVDDILDLSKIQSGKLSVSPRPVPVRTAVDAACAMVSQAAAGKAIALDVVVAPDIVAVADPQRLEQVLLNLVANAVKFTPEGGRVTIHAALLNGGDAAPRVEIVVADSGIGIAPDQLERIFDPFVQGHTGYTREFGGTGLGLNISRRLARLMDGDIVAESTPGVGSRFTVIMPAAAAAPAGK